MNDGPKRVFIADDHPLVRMWLGQLISQQPDMIVCGDAGDARTALACIEASKPDLAIIDISLPDGSGLRLVQDLKAAWPDLKILVFSMHDERTFAERAIRAGAGGYVMKRETADRIIEAIYKTLRDGFAVSPAVQESFDNRFGEGERPPVGPALEQLSDRELEVFQLLGAGIDSRHIAKKLRISMKTVQAHCANIKAKLELPNATELLREAMRWNEFH